MALSKNVTEQTVKNFAVSDKDTGSSPVQIALLTERIKLLTNHFKTHKKDLHSQRGLMKIVSQRKKLLHYLKGKNFKNYQALIQQLNLRK